jgi:lysozyme
MTISPAGIERLKRYEGCRLTVYDDIAGLPTIGWGHLIRAGEPFDSTSTLTQAEADALFLKDVQPFALGVEACLEVEITQEQFDSAVSLAFNIGLDKFRGSSFLRAINSKESNEAIVGWLLVWNKARNPKTKLLEVSSGLVRRRADEAKAWPL